MLPSAQMNEYLLVYFTSITNTTGIFKPVERWMLFQGKCIDPVMYMPKCNYCRSHAFVYDYPNVICFVSASILAS